MKKLISVLLFISVLYLNNPCYPKDLNQKTLFEWEAINARVVSTYKQGDYDIALVLAKQAVQFAEDNAGYNHPITAQSMNNLALLYKTRGQYDEAERLYYVSLTILQLVSNPDDLSIATSMNNLAALYSTMGRYREAESYYRQSLSIKIRKLGSSNLSVALGITNLADLYCLQGQYSQAEPFYRNALTIREQNLGPCTPCLCGNFEKTGRLL